MENTTIPASLATLSVKARELEALVPGCYVDGSADHEWDLNRRIVEFAGLYGFGYDPAIFAPVPEDESDWDFPERLQELSDEAVDYLCELDSTPYAHWSIRESCLVKMADVDAAVGEMHGWKHGTDVIPESELPEFVLSVNDHGNATLYRIELVPVWSVV